MKSIPKQETNLQQLGFASLLQKLGTASPTEIEIALAERETDEPEEELTPEIVVNFSKKNKARKK
ncbi:hypothetical protein [Pseudanabaena yagii]|uniref:Uncharacterized protein n=1 Tax=Pseudanabaena yagii GIHE-NHR1 TaxID=2722753 RepID=A0ABX1LXG9_9CYAN|nr:hypothetical protein [Pseudanabaena yagii]NMF60893.1 hypothetical protein [Pseudanabaena yagii GIHE-NHR1]